MVDNARKRVPFRRRREGKTDYRFRLNLLKSRMPRAVVRKTLTKNIVQFINYTDKGDRVVAHANSEELKKFGWDGKGTTIPSAYLTGVLAAKRANSTWMRTATGPGWSRNALSTQQSRHSVAHRSRH